MNGGRLILSLAGLAVQAGVVRRAGRQLAAWLAVLILVAIAFGYLIASLQLGLAAVLPAPLAMLVTALILLGLAGTLVLVLHLRSRRRAAIRTASQVEALQRTSSDLVRAHPWALIAIAAALGALSGLGQTSTAPRKR